MKARSGFVCLALVGALAGVVAAEEPPMPQATPEHEALGAWVGTWSGEGVLEPGPFGDGGPMTWTEECSWFGDGHFHVVCRSDGTGPMGPMTSLGIMGYDANREVYTHYGIDSSGWGGYAEGTRSGDTWTYESEEVMGGTTYHSRFSVSRRSPDELAFSWEMSEDGDSWRLMMEGTSTRK